jgi:hypothetical protein
MYCYRLQKRALNVIIIIIIIIIIIVGFTKITVRQNVKGGEQRMCHVPTATPSPY